MDNEIFLICDSIYRSVLNVIPSHIAIIGSLGQITWTNRTWQDFSRKNLGNEAQTGVGANYLTVCKEAEKRKVAEAGIIRYRIQEALVREMTDKALEYPCHSPEKLRWFAVKVARIRAGDQSFAVVIHENITARRMLTVQVSDIKKRLCEIERMAGISEWVGVLSHEIKNPLSIILARAGLMKRLAFQGKVHSEFIVNSSGQIEKTVGIILQIVNGLVTMFRDTVQEEVKTVNVKDLCAEARVLTRDRLGSIRFEGPQDASVEGLTLECRWIQILQILINLIRNACDAVEGVSDPWVRLEVESDKEEIRFGVMDNGPGVPLPERQNLMRPGFSTKTREKGAGLGLKISLTLAGAHGGTIVLDESSPHTRFVLILPRRQTQSNAHDLTA